MKFIPCAHVPSLSPQTCLYRISYICQLGKWRKTKTISVKIPINVFLLFTLDLSETSLPEEIFVSISALLV